MSGLDVAVCCQCGSDTDVRRFSPDLDITPVPLCLLCYLALLYGDPDACRCPCHRAVQPGLVPCPRCDPDP